MSWLTITWLIIHLANSIDSYKRGVNWYCPDMQQLISLSQVFLCSTKLSSILVSAKLSSIWVGKIFIGITKLASVLVRAKLLTFRWSRTLEFLVRAKLLSVKLGKPELPSFWVWKILWAFWVGQRYCWHLAATVVFSLGLSHWKRFWLLCSVKSAI